MKLKPTNVAHGAVPGTSAFIVAGRKDERCSLATEESARLDGLPSTPESNSLSTDNRE